MRDQSKYLYYFQMHIASSSTEERNISIDFDNSFDENFMQLITPNQNSLRSLTKICHFLNLGVKQSLDKLSNSFDKLLYSTLTNSPLNNNYYDILQIKSSPKQNENISMHFTTQLNSRLNSALLKSLSISIVKSQGIFINLSSPFDFEQCFTLELDFDDIPFSISTPLIYLSSFTINQSQPNIDLLRFNELTMSSSDLTNGITDMISKLFHYFSYIPNQFIFYDQNSIMNSFELSLITPNLNSLAHILNRVHKKTLILEATTKKAKYRTNHLIDSIETSLTTRFNLSLTNSIITSITTQSNSPISLTSPFILIDSSVTEALHSLSEHFEELLYNTLTHINI